MTMDGAANEELDAIARDLEELDAQMTDAGGSYPKPVLLSQINYLTAMTSRADQATPARSRRS